MNLSTLKQYLFNNLWFGENSREQNLREHLYLAPGFDEKKAIVASMLPDYSRVWGLDISHWNGLTDLQAAKNNGCSFVIIKACDGSIPTRWFSENKARAKAAGLPWGCYVWLYPGNRVPVGTQVAAWWNLVKDDYPPFYVWIDFEWTSYAGQAANPNTGDLISALDKFQAVSGRRAGIYSAKGYTDQYLTNTPAWDNEMWWVANYGVSTPALPRGVTHYKLWQFTSSLDGWIAPSQNRSLDGNYYSGNAVDFSAEIGGIVQPPTGGPMWYKVNTAALNIRRGPGASYQDIGDMLRNDVIETVETAPRGWVKMNKWYRGTTQLPLPDIANSWCSNAYLIATTPPIVVPPLPEEDTIMIMNFTAEHIHKDRATGEILERWLGEGSVEMTKVE